jgi:hypothetical protein
MKRFMSGFAVAAFAAGVAWAGDAPPAAKDAVEIKLAAKVGDVFRFRQTDSSSTEVDGKPRTAEESTQDYSVTVKAVRPDGGLDLDVSFEAIHNKSRNPATAGNWMEMDSSKPTPAGADMQTQMMSAIGHAMVGRSFQVTLDAHGAPTAVSGLREMLAAGIKGSPFEAMLPVDQIFGDKDCMKLAVSLFVGAPAGAPAVGAKWTGDVKDEISNQAMDFSAESTLSAATADDATVASKLTWKPGAKATADGAKPAGGGDSTTKFSRKDGLVLSMKKHLEANRETTAMKATSHTDATIERLPPADKKPADPAKPADPPTKK